jgi:hypothetical protein
MYKGDDQNQDQADAGFKELKLKFSKGNANGANNSSKEQNDKSAFELQRPPSSNSGAVKKNFNMTGEVKDTKVNNHLVPVVKQPANGGPPSTAMDQNE